MPLIRVPCPGGLLTVRVRVSGGASRSIASKMAAVSSFRPPSATFGREKISYMSVKTPEIEAATVTVCLH